MESDLMLGAASVTHAFGEVCARPGLCPAPIGSMEVVDRTGLTYRQLDYWTRAGLIEALVDAEGSGTNRLWCENVVDVILDMRERIRQCPFPHRGH